MKKKPEVVVKAGVGVIVCRNHKILIGKRLGSHGEGHWAFPGGHIEPSDKSLAEAGEREVFQETGIVCNIFSPDDYRQDLFTTYDILSKDATKIYVTCYLVADYLLGDIVRDGDIEKIRPLEPDKCEGWYFKTLEELATLIVSPEAKTWIPINQVIFYLKQMWGVT